jgi:hypothetical protein
MELIIKLDRNVESLEELQVLDQVVREAIENETGFCVLDISEEFTKE